MNVKAASLKIPLFLIISSLFAPLCKGGDSPDLEMAWRITLRDKEVGYSLSRFFYLDEETGHFLKEEGTKVLYGHFAALKITFVEDTLTIWDEDGLISTFTSLRDINGTSEIRKAERREDGSLVWRLEKGDKVQEKTFGKDDFDFTGRDFYFKDIYKESSPVVYRILSVNDGKIYSITYRARGSEKVEGTNGILNCHKVETNGPMGDGVLLIHDMGIPISFTTRFFLGKFSFYPCKLSDVSSEIFDDSRFLPK